MRRRISMSEAERETRTEPFVTDLRAIIRDLEKLLFDVHRCSRRGPLISTLAEVRRAAVDLRQKEEAAAVPFPGDHENDAIPRGKRVGTATDVGELTIGSSRSQDEQLDLSLLISTIDDYTARMLKPFEQAQACLRDEIERVRSFLSELPLGPPDLKDVRRDRAA